MQVARHDETWLLEAEQRWNSKIPIKVWILGPWEGSEASSKIFFWGDDEDLS